MNNKLQQLGRTMMEMMVSLTLMAIVAIAVYGTFRLVVLKADARTLEQEITTRLVQLRHQALTKKGIVTPGPVHKLQASGMLLQAIDQTEHTFTLRVNSDVSALTFDLCERLMKSASFSPWNKDACQKDKDYADFIFPKVADLEKFSDLPTFECGIYAHKEGEDCVCDEGYENWVKDEGCDLVGLECGSHAHRKWDGCQCDDGYEGWVEGEGCSKGCTKDSECSTGDECSACVIPEGQTKGMCRFACTEKGYLESRGSQYIDTSVFPSPELVFTGRAAFTSYSDWNVLFGSVVEDDRYDGIIFRQGGDGTPYRLSTWFCGMPSSGTTGYSFGQFYIGQSSINYVFDFVLSAGVTKVNNFNYTFSTSTGSLSRRNKNTIYLFGGNFNKSFWRGSSARIYKMTIKDGGKVVRDFVPVLDPNGVPAMYDQKEKKLYYNKGSGQFLYGDDTGSPSMAAGPATTATATASRTTSAVTSPYSSYTQGYTPGISTYSHTAGITTASVTTYSATAGPSTERATTGPSTQTTGGYYGGARTTGVSTSGYVNPVSYNGYSYIATGGVGTTGASTERATTGPSTRTSGGYHGAAHTTGVSTSGYGYSVNYNDYNGYIVTGGMGTVGASTATVTRPVTTAGVTSSGGCTSNADCRSGYYCKVTSYNTNGSCSNSNTNYYTNLSGTCQPVSDVSQISLSSSQRSTLSEAGFSSNVVASSQGMIWWSANNWCQAQGKDLIDVADLDCYTGTNTVETTGGSTRAGYCCRSTGSCTYIDTDWLNATSNNKFSSAITALKSVFGANRNFFWTRSAYDNTSSNSCYAWGFMLKRGYVNGFNRDSYFYALCE